MGSTLESARAISGLLFSVPSFCGDVEVDDDVRERSLPGEGLPRFSARLLREGSAVNLSSWFSLSGEATHGRLQFNPS